MFSVGLSSKLLNEKFTRIYFSANVVAAYSPCMLSLPPFLSFSLSRAERTKDSSRYGPRLAAAPCTEIKRKRPRGVDAFIIRCFNLSDSSRPVTVAGAN